MSRLCKPLNELMLPPDKRTSWSVVTTDNVGPGQCINALALHERKTAFVHFSVSLADVPAL